MGFSKTFGWLDTARIGEALFEAHPKTDPLSLRFTELRRLVEGLADFKPEPGHNLNEKILETIQMAWHDERDGVVDQDDEA